MGKQLTQNEFIILFGAVFAALIGSVMIGVKIDEPAALLPLPTGIIVILTLWAAIIIAYFTCVDYVRRHVKAAIKEYDEDIEIVAFDDMDRMIGRKLTDDEPTIVPGEQP